MREILGTGTDLAGYGKYVRIARFKPPNSHTF